MAGTRVGCIGLCGSGLVHGLDPSDLKLTDLGARILSMVNNVCDEPLLLNIL